MASLHSVRHSLSNLYLNTIESDSIRLIKITFQSKDSFLKIYYFIWIAILMIYSHTSTGRTQVVCHYVKATITTVGARCIAFEHVLCFLVCFSINKKIYNVKVFILTFLFLISCILLETFARVQLSFLRMYIIRL